MATGSMSKGPGKSYREGLSLDRLFRMFPTDEAAEAWFTAERWPDGPYCRHCGSRNIQCGIAHPTMTHRCRDCPKRRMFSLKTGTVMQGSPLGYRTWLAAIYLVATNLKGVSSMKLHRDLGIGQKSAWYLAHRIREAWKEVGDPFAGLGQAEPAFRLALQNEAAVRRDQPAPEIGGHLLATYGWKIEREQDIFGYGGRGAFVAWREGRWTTTFYPIPTTYAMSAITSPHRK